MSDDDWTLPAPDQKISRKGLRRRQHHLIDLARRAAAGKANPRGEIGVVISAAQYLGEELTRRQQNRQTCAIIAMTFAITVMTALIMAAAIWPPESVRAFILGAWHWVIDLWPWRGR